jgi:glycosyltransferase involved in cell wall biosynthesis
MSNATNKSKILFLVNDLSFFLSHRFPIAKKAKLNGYDIVIAFGETGGADTKHLEKKGYKLTYLPMERGGKNLFKDLKSLILIFKLFKYEKPNLVHLITIKPYLYGGIISRLTGIKSLVSAVSGLGTLFIHKDLRSRFLRFLLYPIYKFAFNHPNQTVIVQNLEDANLLASWGVLDLKKIKLIKGSGVDLDNFTKFKESDKLITICFVARLLVDKGIGEFISAAKILKRKKINAKFCIAGDIDLNNKSSLSKNELEIIKKEGFVEILGFQENIPELYSQSHIICLPSYREGLPKALIEAAAASRAIVTTDVAGCRDVIEANISGLLVPVRNSEALAEAIRKLIENPDMRKKMGIAGRELALREFGIDKVVDEHMQIFHDLQKF